MTNIQKYFKFKWHYIKENGEIDARTDLISAPNIASAKNIFMKLFKNYKTCVVEEIEEVDKNGNLLTK